VNSDDPEGVISTMDLALRYRQAFGRDVVVDIFCYRKYGHNEGDDPSFTHPLMYKIIEKKKGQAVMYAERCRAEGVVTAEEDEKLRQECRATLRAALQASRAGSHAFEAAGGSRPPREQAAHAPDSGNAYRWDETVQGPSEERLRSIAEKISSVPPGFHIHAKLKRIVEEKAARLSRDGTADWAFAEALAFGSLALEGIPVSLSGQDSARGTFSQRHSIWWDTETPLPSPYTPLAGLSADQAKFAAYDSPLSEYSILGFEYGFSLGMPKALTMWEAQFGDFSNGAQVIIDNYVAAGEAKWGSVSGIVLLLPHGYEGQGPEHSSAHLERFLLLCADDNIQVVNCTTPAQYFHLLRRQVKRSFSKPLIVMTPKSLLRHPQAISQIAELSGGIFHEVLDDPLHPEGARRVILCSGKVSYDLFARRDQARDGSTAILRIEQMYPFPAKPLASVLAGYRGAEVVWVQEEPRNRGAWLFVKDRLERAFAGLSVRYIGREESASPATGSHERHQKEQQEIVREAIPGRAGKPPAGEKPAAKAAQKNTYAKAGEAKAAPARGAKGKRK
jgi:2-oxoglutarate dehydrogenase E1 component